MASYNETLNTAIDRLQEALDDARAMPGWAMSVIVLVSLLTAIVLIHVMAVIMLSPCLYGMWKHRRDQAVAVLLEAEDAPDENEILEPPLESVGDIRDGK